MRRRRLGQGVAGSIANINMKQDELIEISRCGAVLGTVSTVDAVELLAVGFLKADDEFRADAGEAWQALGLLQRTGDGAVSRGAWLRGVVRSAAVAGTQVFDAAGAVARAARELVGSTRTKIVDVPERFLVGFIPQIRQALVSLSATAPVQAVRGGVRDEVLMKKVFGATYDCLPKPVCRFVTEEAFVSFCMKHRGQILGEGDSVTGLDGEPR